MSLHNKHLIGSIGIDLGTANILIHLPGAGVVLQEPTVVTIERATNRIYAFGTEAQQMLGRTPGRILPVHPLQNGVISNFEVTAKLLRYFIGRAKKNQGLLLSRLIVSVPLGVTPVEKRAVFDAVLEAGGRRVFLVEGPIAAALGAGFRLEEPTGRMIVDIGAGTTEMAIISMGGIVSSASVAVAGDELNQAIVNYLKRYFNLMIGERTADEIKQKIGAAHPASCNGELEVKGRDLVTGLPKMIRVNSTQIQEALAEPVAAIVAAVIGTIEKTPPELIANIQNSGIVLSGGGALLKGLDRCLAEAVAMPVHLAEEPLSCVARGLGLAWSQERRTRKRILISSKKMI